MSFQSPEEAFAPRLASELWPHINAARRLATDEAALDSDVRGIDEVTRWLRASRQGVAECGFVVVKHPDGGMENR